ncbi:MAG: bifunctional diaminohydroxyphosphoribosylaminopyrimidine deaminase/5-amino-6-(5-phosphoribosylamino)uracil reductase RibD [Planctomycetota bacterium]|jgi:diaminohydroxyphosphoribosylaminopyrimidine deaminase/5-amino-6-(5-phosphoribosylamino)uracil reductase
MSVDSGDGDFLAMAARLALRGRGGSEPNPMVGCVIVSSGGEVVGWGYHRRCGGPHAEIEALRRAAADAAGATAYVTLEPCNHAGRTGPCTEALIEARVGRVVYARADPGVPAGGGAERLRAAGVDVELSTACPEAITVSDPYVRRVADGLPWVTAKWAQTIDGRIATSSGESQWISNAASRGLVHRRRGHSDAVLTGIGTVVADDPLLTARTPRPRRTPMRVVFDPGLDLPATSRLATTTDQAPTVVLCGEKEIEQQAQRAETLRTAGVELVGLPSDGCALSLEAGLRALVDRYEITNVLVEAGPGLLGQLFSARLVNVAWVFVAPLLFGDDTALPCVRGLTVKALTDGCDMELLGIRRRAGDVILHYRVT